ncbi:MAG: hypothetical protein WC971_00100 [Coriobacteriia bacterium]
MSLAKAEHIELSATDAEQLALWAAKTAAVRALMDKGTRVIPPAHYHWIKQNLTPPPLTHVWIVHCDAPYDTWTRHFRFVQPGFDEQSFGHSTTVILGQMMLHVVGFSCEPMRFSSDGISGIRPGELDLLYAERSEGGAIALWPEPSAFTWPPRVKLSREAAICLTGPVFTDNDEMT